MEQLPSSITLTVVLLTLFLCFITALKYSVPNHFTRGRLIMTSFFVFIVSTLTISFSEYALDTLPFTIPAFIIGGAIGYLLGVRAAQNRLKAEGLAYYTRHFAHIHVHGVEDINWWTLINFYSVMGALALINLVGLSTVIFRHSEMLAIFTSVVGAFLLGTIAPYLVHLWSIKMPQNKSKTTSE